MLVTLDGSRASTRGWPSALTVIELMGPAPGHTALRHRLRGGFVRLAPAISGADRGRGTRSLARSLRRDLHVDREGSLRARDSGSRHRRRAAHTSPRCRPAFHTLWCVPRRGDAPGCYETGRVQGHSAAAIPDECDRTKGSVAWERAKLTGLVERKPSIESATRARTSGPNGEAGTVVRTPPPGLPSFGLRRWRAPSW